MCCLDSACCFTVVVTCEENGERSISVSVKLTCKNRMFFEGFHFNFSSFTSKLKAYRKIRWKDNNDIFWAKKSSDAKAPTCSCSTFVRFGGSWWLIGVDEGRVSSWQTADADTMGAREWGWRCEEEILSRKDGGSGGERSKSVRKRLIPGLLKSWKSWK